MINMTFAHHYCGTNLELWVRPNRVDLSVWDTFTGTISMTPEQAEELAQKIAHAAKEARQ